MKKTARFMRILTQASEPTDDESRGWWVTALLFRVSPPIEFTTYETYRNGRLLHDKRGFPHRDKVAMARGWDAKPDPKYSRSRVHRTTAFVIASASDLKSMMERSRRKMVELGRERGDEKMVKLFENQDPFEVETFLFPAHKDGTWKNGDELDGSQRGTLDHRIPFADIGYEVIGMPDLPPRPTLPLPPLEMEATLG